MNMENKALQQVMDWMRTTDLAEVSYRRGEEGVGFRLDTAPPAAPASFPACSLVPVVSPEVGIYRAGPAGSAGRVEKGAVVAEGAALGLIEVGTRKAALKAPAAGRVVSALIEDGKPVEYGQPLFFIKPE